MLLGRSPALFSRISSLPRHSIQHRLLTIQGQRAVVFLQAEVTKSEVREALSTSQDCIAILIHADRRAQLPPSNLERDGPSHIHYGPSLIACPYHLLDKVSSAAELGPGDMGILKAQRDHHDQVYQTAGSVGNNLPTKDIRALLRHQKKQVVSKMGRPQANRFTGLLQRLYNVFLDYEAVWMTAQLSWDGDSVKVNAPFIEFDDFAVHRIEGLKDLNEQARKERDSNTAQAEDGGLFYRKLNNGGKVGSFGYGAGNAMATMDGLAMAGATPANFLDGGGGANVANAKLAIETLNRDPDVTSIFVNTFGGLTRCSLVAEGIIEAVRENDIKTPMTIRLMGTEADEAKEMLRATGLPFSIEDDFKTAAKLAVSQAK